MVLDAKMKRFRAKKVNVFIILLEFWFINSSVGLDRNLEPPTSYAKKKTKSHSSILARNSGSVLSHDKSCSEDIRKSHSTTSCPLKVSWLTRALPITPQAPKTRTRMSDTRPILVPSYRAVRFLQVAAYEDKKDFAYNQFPVCTLSPPEVATSS